MAFDGLRVERFDARFGSEDDVALAIAAHVFGIGHHFRARFVRGPELTGRRLAAGLRVGHLDGGASRSRQRSDVGVARLDAVAFGAIPGVARAERGTELLVEVVGALRIQRTGQVGGLEPLRSEERRVGKEGVSTYRSRWAG